MATVKNIRTAAALLKVPLKYPTVVFKIFLILRRTPRQSQYHKMREQYRRAVLTKKNITATTRQVIRCKTQENRKISMLEHVNQHKH
jgi:hypothetical protein